MAAKAYHMGLSCTEIKITVAPPWPIPPFQSVALVPGEKTVVTTLRLGPGEGSGLEAEKFALGEQAVTELMVRLACEKESFLTKVNSFH
jgi:hypothetical protein